MLMLRGMRSAKVLMSCHSSWASSEPRISTLGGILTLGTPPADRSTADCPLLLTVAALSHSLASSAALFMVADNVDGWLLGLGVARARDQPSYLRGSCQ